MKGFDNLTKAIWIIPALLIFSFSTQSVSAQNCQSDTIDPVIELNTNDSVLHPVNSPYTPADVSVYDNCSDSDNISVLLSSNVNPFVLGIYYDRYTATDASGNSTIKMRWVFVGDTIPPVISVGKNGQIIRFDLGEGSREVLPDYIVLTDNYSSPSYLRSTLEVEDDIDFNQKGLYSADFITRDEAGNYSDKYRLYVVVGSYPPLGISKPGIDVQVSPNPAMENISIKLRSTYSSISILQIGITGNVVAAERYYSNTSRIDYSLLGESGIYFLLIETSAGEKAYVKVIKH